MRQRLDDGDGGVEDDPEGRAERMHRAGKLDEAALRTAFTARESAGAAHALARYGGTPLTLCSNGEEAAAVLVALNSLVQIAAYSLLGYFYLELLPGWLGLEQSAIDFSIGEVAKAVAVFLGIPLVAGSLPRRWGEVRRGREWYETRFLPKIAPVALWGLLFTIVVLFALQGEKITDQPMDVARIAVPLVAYFGIMWTGSFLLSKRIGLGYPRAASVAFTAAGNNFELAIAVAISVFGVTSGQALAGVVGPLIEVPVLVALVYVALWARRRLYHDEELRP